MLASPPAFQTFYLYIQEGICKYIQFPTVYMSHCCGMVPGNTHETPATSKNNTITVNVEIPVEQNTLILNCTLYSHFGRLGTKT